MTVTILYANQVQFLASGRKDIENNATCLDVYITEDTEDEEIDNVR